MNSKYRIVTRNIIPRGDVYVIQEYKRRFLFGPYQWIDYTSEDQQLALANLKLTVLRNAEDRVLSDAEVAAKLLKEVEHEQPV